MTATDTGFPLFLTADAAAKMLGVSPEVFLQLVASGYLPPEVSLSENVTGFRVEDLRAVVENPEPGVLGFVPPSGVVAQGWARKLLCTNLSPTCRALGAFIALRRTDAITGKATVQMGDLVKDLHLSMSSVRTALGILEGTGWLHPCGGNRSQGQRIYELRIPSEGAT